MLESRTTFSTAGIAAGAVDLAGASLHLIRDVRLGLDQDGAEKSEPAKDELLPAGAVTAANREVTSAMFGHIPTSTR